MEALYLRVKNWPAFQHYDPLLRRPPWIKLYNDLLEDDAFMRLDEFTQWQLVRVWMVASKSSSLTVDGDGKQVPVVANDAMSLQRSIASVKKVPLALFIREGWLVPVAENDLIPPGQVKSAKRRRGASKTAAKPPESASNGASATASDDASVTLRSRKAESRGSDLDQIRNRQVVPPDGPVDAVESLPIDIENELLVARLMQRIGDDADDGTRRVVRSYATRLPPAALSKVVESIEIHECEIADRARYAVGALKAELDERSAA